VKPVLVASLDPTHGTIIQESMGPEYTIEQVRKKNDCLKMFRKRRYEFLFMDIAILTDSKPNRNYKQCMEEFFKIFPTAEIIVMSPPGAIREAVMAVKAGAGNYLTYPINPEEVRLVTDTIRASIIVQSELDYHRQQSWQEQMLDLGHTKNPVMNRVFAKIRSVATTRSTVLLEGETGTGKSMLAKLIHLQSNRKEGPFISVHCGAIPDTLIESELFGHEKGAFTGAHRRKLGKFEIAKHGTIFLDEIGTISPSAQIKLLHILQDGTFQRLGGEETLEANARVIAATNCDLKQLCEEGRFRKDLYYRLNVFPIELPPLRQRREDIELIASSLLMRLNQKYAKEIHEIHPQVIDVFHNYSWPGNIRELENLIERAYILESSSRLTPDSFPHELFSPAQPSPLLHMNTAITLSETRLHALTHIEYRYLREVLTLCKGRINDAARVAGVTPRQLHKLMKKHGLKKEDFKCSALKELQVPKPQETRT